MPAFLTRHAPRPPGSPPMTDMYRLYIVPIVSIHLGTGVVQPTGSARNANVDLLCAMGIIGVLIVVIASISFINPMTARASRRAVEVGVRKALGAGRPRDPRQPGQRGLELGDRHGRYQPPPVCSGRSRRPAAPVFLEGDSPASAPGPMWAGDPCNRSR